MYVFTPHEAFVPELLSLSGCAFSFSVSKPARCLIFFVLRCFKIEIINHLILLLFSILFPSTTKIRVRFQSRKPNTLHRYHSQHAVKTISAAVLSARYEQRYNFYYINKFP